MKRFERCLLENKVKFIRAAREALKRDFNLIVPEGHGFTRKKIFHHIITGGKRYVHKEALKFYLSNAYTYDPDFGQRRRVSEADLLKIKEETQANIESLFSFFSGDINSCLLYPKLLDESESFFVFDFYHEEDGWEVLKLFSKKDFSSIMKLLPSPKNRPRYIVTPFYNQMYGKILKNKLSGKIKIVDLKNFEIHPKGRNFIYLYDKNEKINDLYLPYLQGKREVLKKLAGDYPVYYARLHRVPLFDFSLGES